MRKTILITGASSGIGEGLAREHAAAGRDLALCARRTKRLEALRAELSSKHPNIKVVVRALDVTDHPQVFRVFEEFAAELGSLDRIIVNAGIGKGRGIGTGHFETNKETAETNFVAALAQCEAAVAIFRRQQRGHLVVISSMSALRGMPKNLTTYAATKAGLSSLAEGIRAELMATKIKVSAIFPGYIETEITAGGKGLPFIVDAVKGCRAMFHAIEREPARAFVPAWPWALFARLMAWMPLRVVAKLA